jgi:ABC-type multidrug transport system fused ATPase/permease subunit
MKNNIKETVVTVALIAIAILLLNPFHFWMPDMMVMTMLAVILVLFAIFASFILREKAGDERDDQHKALAGRNAFLAGSATLILGIIVQGYAHAVDGWLVVGLIIMVMTKIGTRIWSDRNL